MYFKPEFIFSLFTLLLTYLLEFLYVDYHCGGWDGWSAVFSFKTFKSGVDWSPRLAVFGDLGSVNAKSLSYLQEETQMGHFDGILHVGEFNFYFYFCLFHNLFFNCTCLPQ